MSSNGFTCYVTLSTSNTMDSFQDVSLMSISALLNVLGGQFEDLLMT